MAFWDKWFRREEAKYTTLDLFREVYGGRASTSGVAVTWARALEVATVLACCRVLAEGVAQVPFKLFVEGADGIRKPATDHDLYRLLFRRPNRWQTSFEFRETLMLHLVLTGNAYVFVGRVGRAREVRELVPLEPQLVSVKKNDDGRLTYQFRPANGPVSDYDQSQIWHLKGPSWSGWQGLEAVKLARDAIGLSIATETAHADLHKSGAKVSGAYSIDGTLSKERYEFLNKYLDEYAMGGTRAGKPLILDQGAKWLAQQMSGVDAQHIETRDHQIDEICRAFRVMPIMIGKSDKAATYASAEQMFIAHVVHTLTPWYERIEQSADAALLSEDDIDAGHYFKFLPNGLMRGAAKDRAEFYTRAIGSVNASPGWMTENEIRALEELPPMEGGDKIFKPEPAPVAPPSDDDGVVKHLATEFARSISDIAAGTKALALKETPPPMIKVDVAAPQVTVEGAKTDIHNHIPRRPAIKKDVVMDNEGRMIGVVETEIED